MNAQRWTIAIVVVIVLAVGGWFIFGRSNSSSPATSPSASPVASMSMAPQSSSSSPAAATGTSSVTISNFAFSPVAISVKKGSKVTWTNQDSVGHTVTETDGQTGPSSSTLDQGASYSFTFNTAGTFHYHCSIHPNMVGTVTVTD